MANRRMFSKSVVDTDHFLDMGAGAQLLYYNLGIHADDDGFVTAPKKIMRNCRATDGDMKELIREGFIIAFPSGVIVITHWRENNFIRNDRYNPTTCTEEKALLGMVKDGVYGLLAENPQVEALPPVTKRKPPANQKTTDGNQQVNQRDTSGIPDGIPLVDQRYTQVRLGKDRLVQDSLELGEDKVKKPKKRTSKPFSPPSLQECREYYESKNFTFPLEFFFEYYSQSDWHDVGGKKVKNWKLKMLTWQHNYDEKKKRNPAKQESFMQHTPEENAESWGWDE